jgi:hypothetical protein
MLRVQISNIIFGFVVVVIVHIVITVFVRLPRGAGFAMRRVVVSFV